MSLEFAIATAISQIGALAYNALADRPDREVGKVRNQEPPQAELGFPFRQPIGTKRLRNLPLFWSLPLQERKKRSGGGKGGGQTTEYRYFVTAAWIIGRKITDIKRVWFQDEKVFDRDTTDPEEIERNQQFWDHCEVFYGDLTQPASATIQSFEEGEIPAFGGISYLTTRDYPCRTFGQNTIPTVSVEVEGEGGATLTLPDAISVGCRIAGLQPSEYDVSQVPATEIVYGGIVNNDGGSVLDDYLNDLLRFFQIVSRERDDGVLEFIPQRRSAISDQIDIREIAARISSENLQTRYEGEIIDYWQTPSRIEIQYPDFNNEHETGYARAYNPNAIFNPAVDRQNDNALTITTTIVSKREQMDTIAARMMYQLIIQQYNFKTIRVLPYKNYLQPGDVFILVNGNIKQAVQIREKREGINYLLEFDVNAYGRIEGYTFEDGEEVTIENLNQSHEQTVPTVVSYPPKPITVYGRGTPVPLDIPIFDTSGTEIGLDVAIQAAENFRQGTLYISIDDINYVEVGDVFDRSTVGTVQQALPAAERDEIDSTTVLTVDLAYPGTIDPVSQAEFDNNQLIVLIGNEIIAVRDVTAISETQLEISYFRRGLFGTWIETGNHTPGERIVVLRGETVRIPGSLVWVGQTVYFKLVSPGQTLSSATAVSVNIEAKCLFPYAPSNILGKVDADNNLLLSCTPEYRPEPFRTGEEIDSFEYVILNSSGTGAGTIVRTLSANGTNTAIYPKELIVADFGSFTTNFDVICYKISSISSLNGGTGRGFAGTAFPLTIGDPIAEKTWIPDSEEFKGQFDFSATPANAIADHQGFWIAFDTDTAAGEIEYQLDNALQPGFHVYLYNSGVTHGVRITGFTSLKGEDILTPGKSGLLVHAGNGLWVFTSPQGTGTGIAHVIVSNQSIISLQPNTTHGIKTPNGGGQASFPADPPDNTFIGIYDAAGSDPYEPTGFGKGFTLHPAAGQTIQGYAGSITLQENESYGFRYSTLNNRWSIEYASVQYEYPEYAASGSGSGGASLQDIWLFGGI